MPVPIGLDPVPTGSGVLGGYGEGAERIERIAGEIVQAKSPELHRRRVRASGRRFPG
jgi:hypothetical protein